MTDLRALLAPIRERLAAATPGPWEAYDANDGDWPPRPMWCVGNDAFHNPNDHEDEDGLAVEVHTGCKEDAEFIANAPADQAKLLAAIEGVIGEIADTDLETNEAVQGDLADRILGVISAALGSDTTNQEGTQ